VSVTLALVRTEVADRPVIWPPYSAEPEIIGNADGSSTIFGLQFENYIPGSLTIYVASAPSAGSAPSFVATPPTSGATIMTSVTTGSSSLLGADPFRVGFSVTNTSSFTIYLGLLGNAATYGINPIAPGATYTAPPDGVTPQGAVAICSGLSLATGGTATVSVTEANYLVGGSPASQVQLPVFSSTAMLAPNSSRAGFSVTNNSTGNLYLGLQGANAVSGTNTVPPGGVYTAPSDGVTPEGGVSVLFDAGSTGYAVVSFPATTGATNATITFKTAPSAGSYVAARYQATAFSDSDLQSYLTNALAANYPDSRTTLKAVLYDLIPAIVADQRRMEMIGQADYRRDPGGYRAGLLALRASLKVDLMGAPLPGTDVPALSIAGGCVTRYEPIR
jgi:hypothetical protein